jgi:uncharacterized membrane protein
VTPPEAEPAPGTPRAGPRPARTFTLLAGAAGLCFVLLTPPLQAPDEIRHLMRASAIARGQLLATAQAGQYATIEIPRDVVELEKRLDARSLYRHTGRRADRRALAREARRPLDESDRMRVALPSLYSPLAYLPQAFAMATLRAFAAPAVAHVWAGRLANLAVYLLLVAFALRRAPAHRWTLCLIAATPIAVFEAAALGADAFTNGAAFAFIAAVLAAAARRGPLAGRELGELAALAALVALAKPGYSPLALLVALVPGARFASPRARAGAAAAVLAAGVLPAALWMGLLQTLPLRPLTSWADPQAQIAHVLEHPLRVIGVLAQTLVRGIPAYVRTGVSDLGHLDVALPTVLWAVWPLVVAAVAVADGGRASPVRGAQRALLPAIALACWVAAMLLAYVGWNRVGDDAIRYVQGRYFLPFAPLPFLALHRSGGDGPSRRGAQAVVVAVALALAIAVAAVARRYWG